jgi:hypothetical protein
MLVALAVQMRLEKIRGRRRVGWLHCGRHRSLSYVKTL